MDKAAWKGGLPAVITIREHAVPAATETDAARKKLPCMNSCEHHC